MSLWGPFLFKPPEIVPERGCMSGIYNTKGSAIQVQSWHTPLKVICRRQPKKSTVCGSPGADSPWAKEWSGPGRELDHRPQRYSLFRHCGKNLDKLSKGVKPWAYKGGEAASRFQTRWNQPSSSVVSETMGKEQNKNHRMENWLKTKVIL